MGAGVRVRGGTVDPTSTVGFPLNAGDILEYDGPPDKLKFIRSGSVDATIEAFYSA